MLDLKLINQFNIDNLEIYKMNFNKQELELILKEVKEKQFLNNDINYISFQFYKNTTFVVMISETNNKESVVNVKKFDCLNKELLFKQIKILENNKIRDFISSIDIISRAYVTINYELFKYIVENINNTFVIQMDNTFEIKVFADDVELPIKYYIYKKSN